MSEQSNSNRLVWLLGLLGVALAIGLVYWFWPAASETSKNTVHLQGTVSFQGQPLAAGLIVFEPDAARGAFGTQGFATITNGEFDTRRNGKPAAIGASIARITGGDGKGVEAFTPYGSMLFEEYSQALLLEAVPAKIAIDIPDTGKKNEPPPQ